MNPALTLVEADTAARTRRQERTELPAPPADATHAQGWPTRRSMAATSAARYLGVKIPQGGPASRDGYGWHPLHGGRALCAWVADAPDDARVDTAELIHQAVRKFFYSEPETEQVIAGVASGEEARILLADLVTHVSDALLEAACQHRMPCHAAAVFLLATAHGLHFITVGDCAAIVFLDGPDAIYRLSGTTRVSSCMRLDLLPGLSQPGHYQEACYLGAQRQMVHPADVITLPLRGMPRIALMSDGPERQTACADLLETVRGLEMGSATAQDELEAFLGSQPPVDDLTLLVFDAMLAAAPGEPAAGGAQAQPGTPPVQPPPAAQAGLGRGFSLMVLGLLLLILATLLFTQLAPGRL